MEVIQAHRDEADYDNHGDRDRPWQQRPDILLAALYTAKHENSG